MPDRQLDEEAVFHTARRIDDPEGRSYYLDQVCGDKPPSRPCRALLEVHEQEQDFLKSAAEEPEPTVDMHQSASPGDRSAATS